MLALSCAVSEYEHVRDLETGRVKPEGIDLNLVILPVEEVFFRSLRFKEFDISEMSMGRYVATLSSGDSPFVAIPVFPSRMFRHSAIYVKTNGSVRTPKDLRGARVGVPEWAQTAGIYVRGLLADEYKVPAADVEWVQGGLEQPGREEEVTIELPAGVRLRRVEDRTLNDMLLRGELDALISAHPPIAFKQGDPNIRTLFDDPAEVESRFWQDTGIFPIMHTIVIKRDIFESNRWIAMNLQQAFADAKNRCIARARDKLASRFPIPFMNEFVRATNARFGDDFWPYGIEPNRKTLSAFLRFAHMQGVTRHLLQVDELFPPEVMQRFKI